MTSELDTTLIQYIDRMKEGDEKIYYSIADSYEAAANSPHIEHLKANDTEVLLLTDRIDEWLMSTLDAIQRQNIGQCCKRRIRGW